MKYHAPTKQFTIPRGALGHAADSLLVAIRHIRAAAGLPLTAYEMTHAQLSHADHAQKQIIDAALAVGIDLGGQWGNELDVSKV